MDRLVKKVNLPILGEMYVANVEDINLEGMQALQGPLKKLHDYEEEEGKGLLLHLPCKVGDVVYEPRKDLGIISGSDIFYKWMIIDGVYSNLDGFSQEDVGKKYF